MTGTDAAPAATTADDVTAEIRLEVARAIFSAAAGPEEDWGDLSEDDQSDFLAVAGAAITAYRGWLARKGFRMTPPGSFAAPSSEVEGRAMLAVAQGYLASIKRKQKLVSSPGLILPGSRH